jgi:ankyrin repeat protein
VELFRAIESADRASVVECLKSAIEVNVRDRFGRTPLGLASTLGSTDIVKLLLEHRANADFPDSIGRTPLMLAVRNDHADAVAVLLKAGADPTATDTTGHSVLWHCMHREIHFVAPLVSGLHGTVFTRRLLRTRSRRVIDDALKGRT